jgi:UDP-N-acetyl-alpha-D-muramoyl-L-alanyl-L-glutamate epimerase
MTDAPPAQRALRFRYVDLEIDAHDNELRCHYALDAQPFVERIVFGDVPPGAWGLPGVEAAAAWVFLLAGVSYYKAGAPPVIDVGDIGLSPADGEFLRAFYLDGLAEFAYRNALDLSPLDLITHTTAAPAPTSAPDTGAPYTQPSGLRPLVPFGGGIDSIVTAELARHRAGDDDTKLFVVSKAGDRFAAIETAAAATGLGVIRADRALDPQILQSKQLGYLNGHVPVTGVISAIAVLAALLHRRDAVVMSNEASASSGNLVADGRVVNHQWSKGIDFEIGFRHALARHVIDVDYFSMLRSASELWVAQRFAELPQYHRAFRSCNRAFYVDPARRLDHWCGECDKCCFVDLVLAPFLERAELEAIFAGHEPLGDDSLADRFRTLLATSRAPKPFDCVGDTPECRSALRLTAARLDRAGAGLVHRLVAELVAAPDTGAGPDLFRPAGPNFIPDAYAPGDLLV